jgi:hypothetical protein
MTPFTKLLSLASSSLIPAPGKIAPPSTAEILPEILKFCANRRLTEKEKRKKAKKNLTIYMCK